MGGKYKIVEFDGEKVFLAPGVRLDMKRKTKIVAHGNKGLTDVDEMLMEAYIKAGLDYNLIG